MSGVHLHRPASGVHHGRRSLLQACYAGSPWLTVTGCLMLADIVVTLVGLAVDPTLITGAPAWLKPLKFGLSTALYSFTVAWIIGILRRTRRFASVLGRITAAALVVEIALIDMQAARHTSSHFNIASRFDASVFQVMGISIALLFLSTVLLFAAAIRERFTDRALGWAVRLGLALALAGMSTGFLMVLPTPEQLAVARAGGGLPRSGAHTVGAPDGGRALPITGWSADHGDLRIAHFAGLHGMQVLLLGWWLVRVRARAAWTQARRTRLVFIIAAGYAAAFAALLWQALRGQPLLRPDALTLAAWCAWLVCTAACLLWIISTHSMTAPNTITQDTVTRLEARS